MKTRKVLIKTLKEIKKISTRDDIGYRPTDETYFTDTMMHLADTAIEISQTNDGLDWQTESSQSTQWNQGWYIAEWMIEKDLNPHDDPEYYL